MAVIGRNQFDLQDGCKGFRIVRIAIDVCAEGCIPRFNILRALHTTTGHPCYDTVQPVPILVLTCHTTLYCNPEDHKMNYLVILQKAICLFTCLLSLRMLILWRKYLILFQCSFSLCFGMKSSCVLYHFHIFHLCNVSSVYLFLQDIILSHQYHLSLLATLLVI